MNNDPNYFLQSYYGDFNDPTTDSSGYGALPAVEQTQTYIAYFDGVGGTGPELIDQTGYFIKYLVDSNGNVSKPAPGNTALINLKDNFELGKTIVVESKNATQALATLLGEHTVSEIGTITPLVVTETGSARNDYLTQIQFAQEGAFVLTGNIPDYTFKANVFPDSYSGFGSIVFNYPPTKSPGNTAASWTFNTLYTLLSNTYDYGSPLKVTLMLQLKNNYTNPGFTYGANVAIRKNGNNIPINVDHLYHVNGGTVVNDGYSIDTDNLLSLTIPAGDSSVRYLKISTYFNDYANGDVIDAILGPDDYNISLVGGWMNIDTIYNTDLTLIAPYWSGATWPTDNSTPQWITASLSMSGFLNNNMVQITPTASLSMSFSNIVYPANIRPGDYIRFEYTPLKQSKIYEVNTLNDGRLAFKIFPAISSGSKLDHFVIWRAVDDGNYITLNVKKQSAGQISGWLKPKHMSQELHDNFTNIVNKLETSGLLT